jgi:hypothetical protein
MKRIKYAILTLGLLVGFGLALMPINTHADSVLNAACADPSASNSALCKEASKSDQLPTVTKTITNTLLYVLGAVSVIVIIIAGILYATSSGDASLITKAKNTLLYAVVGLVVAIMAYAIVNFVITQFK